MSDIYVVDTNVAVVANGQSGSAQCQIACIEMLEAIVDSKMIGLDDANLIFAEYQRYLSFSGEPGVGDAFMKWVHDNTWNPARCVLVHLTETDGKCDQFPADPALDAFDDSDRKFAAVALVAKASVVNATDTDWKHHEAALNRAGIQVISLCPADLEAGRAE